MLGDNLGSILPASRFKYIIESWKSFGSCEPLKACEGIFAASFTHPCYFYVFVI